MIDLSSTENQVHKIKAASDKLHQVSLIISDVEKMISNNSSGTLVESAQSYMRKIIDKIEIAQKDTSSLSSKIMNIANEINAEEISNMLSNDKNNG